MTQGKFTPGPWKIDSIEVPFKGLEEYLIGGEFTHIGSIQGWKNGRIDPETTSVASYKEGRANARLIAAAPELLEALERIWYSAGQEGHKYIEQVAEAAIAKATGGA